MLYAQKIRFLLAECIWQKAHTFVVKNALFIECQSCKKKVGELDNLRASLKVKLYELFWYVYPKFQHLLLGL